MNHNKSFALFLIPLILAVLACNLPSGDIGTGGSSAAPLVGIVTPTEGTVFQLGDEIAVTSTTIDPTGITKLELQINGQTVRSDTPDGGTTEFTLTQTFTASEPGTLTIIVIATNSGNYSASAGPISVEVSSNTEADETETPTPTPSLESESEPVATDTTEATSTETATSTATETATLAAVIPSDTPPATPLVADGAVFVSAVRDPADSSYGLVTMSVEFSGGVGPYTVFDAGLPLTTSDPQGSFERGGRQMFWIHYGPIRWRCGTALPGQGVIESKDGQRSSFDFFVTVTCP